jgi:hypothetical protein
MHVWTNAQQHQAAEGSSMTSNPFVRLMVVLALPAVGSLIERWSARMVKSMKRNQEIAERYLEATMAAAGSRGLVVGPVHDVSETVTREGREQLRLDFPVLSAEGAVVSRRGVCRVTLGRTGEAERVHSFYEQTDGSIVDLLLETPGEAEGAAGPLIVEAEVVRDNDEERRAARARSDMKAADKEGASRKRRKD